MNVKCNYCSKDIKVSTRKYNDNVKRYNGNFFCSHTCTGLQNSDNKFGRLKEYTVKCKCCSKDFSIQEREKLYPQKEHYFCSKFCARSYSRSKSVTKLKTVNCQKCGIELIVKHRSSKYICDNCKSRKPPVTIHKSILIGSCDQCGNKTKNNNSFCNTTCYSEYNYHIKINEQLSNLVNPESTGTIKKQIRKYLFKLHNNNCQKCGQSELNIKTNTSPLTVHHIDGNTANNRFDNLELLCPNCHSITPNYGSLNKVNSIKRKK